MIDHVDITVGDHKYRVDRIKARAGSWLVHLQAKANLTEQEHANLHDHLLAVCARYTSGAPLPITKNGEFVEGVKDLEYDLDTVDRLKSEVIKLNFRDFFVKRLREFKEAQEAAAKAQSTDSTSE